MASFDCRKGELADHPRVAFLHEVNPQAWSGVEALLRPLATSTSAGSVEDEFTELQNVIWKSRACTKFGGGRETLGALGKAWCQAEARGLPAGHLAPFLARLALRLPELFAGGIPMLTKGRSGQVLLSRRQCAAILAASFFGALPGVKEQSATSSGEELTLPDFDLSFVLSMELEKVLCLLSYFHRVALAEAEKDEAFLSEVVSFARRAAEAGSADTVFQRLEAFWSGLDKPLLPARVVAEGAIEHSEGNLQADFANEYLGGGVLHGGNVQEEIRFSVCPECLVGMLFCEVMLPNEAIFIVGPLQYSKYSGYGGSFRFAGSCLLGRESPADALGRRGPHIACFDALCFPGIHQYEVDFILRELQKVHVACLGDPEEASGPRQRGFATGNWGCGVFGGDPQLKSLIQWLAASAAGRELVYYPFGDGRVQDLPMVIKKIQDSGAVCRDLYQLLQGNGPNAAFERVMRRLEAGPESGDTGDA